MAQREITDSRNGMFSVDTYRQDFPYIGAVATSTVKQSATGYANQSIAHTYTNHVLDSAAGNQRYLPYRSQSVVNGYEVGGVKNGAWITEVTETHVVNTLGNSTSITIDAKDKDALSPETGAIYRTQIASTYSENQADWCLALPLTRTETQ